MNKMRNSVLVKVIGLVCTLALVLGAIYVPVTMSAFAATIPVTPDETMTFSFEPAEDPAINNGSYKDRAEDGFGLASWGISVSTLDGAKVIGKKWIANYKQNGGYRLNNKDGVYRLDTSSRYVVRFKLSLRSAPTPETVAEMKTNAYINLGYGFTGGPASSTGNQVKTMDAVLARVAQSSGNVYTVTDISGTREVVPSDKWYDLTYVLETPANFSGKNNSFGFFAMNIAGTEFYIDEVQVTKLGSNTGLVLANDPYNAETKVMLGAVGTDVELPALVGKQEDHQFLGWYTDEDRTVPAQNLKYTVETQNAYAKWRAPVFLTFKDSHNGTESTIKGYTADTIPFPQDPVDTKNTPAKYLFDGWYTTEMFTQKYEETAFGSSDITIYAKWVEKEQEFTQDFEDYSYSDKTATGVYEIDGANQVKYTNSEHFATPMAKIDDPTNSGRGKVVKFEWDPNMTYVEGNPDTYNAAAEYTIRRNGSITMGDHTFVDGMQYIMYFDYYVEDIGTQRIRMFAYNIRYNQGWEVGEALDTMSHYVTANDKDGKWHTGAVILTMKEATTAGPYIHAMFRNETNGKAKVYLDNFRFVPVQINEVIMTVNNGTVAPAEYVPVVKGAALDIPVPTVEGRTFKGWYSDSNCTTLFKETVAPGYNFTVYSRWNEVPQDFQNYPYSTANDAIFGKTVSIIKGEGVGHEDDAVAKFTLDGDAIYAEKNGVVTYWASRAASGGHVIKLGEVTEGEVYKVSFWYKGDSAANVNSTIRLQTASPSTCWTNYKTDTKTITVTPSTTEWQKAEYLYYCSLKAPTANGLFIRFNSSGKNDNLDQLAIAYIDDIVVEKIDKPYVIFNSQDGKLANIVQGNAGEKINIPQGAYKLGYDFAGWYLDKAFTEEFTDTVFVENKGVTVYAKYETAAKYGESFENYSYNTANDAIFGKTVSIVKGKGVGHEDDAVAKFTLDGDAIYEEKNGVVTYWASRAASGGHVIKLGEVTEGEVYKVSFWYKGDSAAKVNSTIRLQTASPSTCWTNSKTNTKTITVTPSTTEWQKAEYLYYCSLKAPTANGLFIRFNSSGKNDNLDQLAIAYIDDFVIERIEKPFVIFDGLNKKQGVIVQGKAGEKIKVPANPKLVGMKFLGWYTDKEFKEPFTQTVFEDGMGITVYAKYDYADSFTVNFENVGKNRGEEDDYLFYRGGMGAVEKVGYKNSTGLLFDRTATNEWASTNALFEEGNQVIISNENKYYVTFKYCVTEQQKTNGFVYLRAASPGNGWGAKYSKAKFEDAGVICVDYPIPGTAEVGRWYTAKVILDTSKIFVHSKEEGGNGDPKAYAAMYMYYRGGAGKIVVDDVTFKKLPKGHQAYIVDNGGASSVPSYVSGRIGTSFRSQLPKNPQYENHIFKNYFRYDKTHNQDILEDKDMVFTKDNLNLVTSWVRLHTVQDFENFATLMYTYPGFGPADFDYELYDAKKEGNSADNVTSGRYSIHRKGTTAFFENIQILPDDLRICGDEKFTVKMKVKVGKHFHTDGAIKIVGCKSPTYAWTTSGSFHPIAPIADIADGQWHEVSYTFSSVERYLAIQTPGYVEVFIDDVVIDRADPEMPVSTPPEYTEYVQALRDKDGNLINVDTASIDVGSIIDFSLYIGGFNIVPVLIIVGGVVLVAAAVALILFVIKKRKAKKV